MVGEIPDWVNTIKDKISFFMENIGGILMDLWEMKELKDLFFDNIEQFKEFIKLVKVTDQNFDDMGYSCKTKNTLEMETT